MLKLFVFALAFTLSAMADHSTLDGVYRAVTNPAYYLQFSADQFVSTNLAYGEKAFPVRLITPLRKVSETQYYFLGRAEYIYAGKLVCSWDVRYDLTAFSGGQEFDSWVRGPKVMGYAAGKCFSAGEFSGGDNFRR